MALYSWSALYHDPATTLVDAAAMPIYEQLAHDCIELVPEFEAFEKAEKPLNREQFLKADPTDVEPWKWHHANEHAWPSIGRCAGVSSAGSADTTVRPEITKQFGEQLFKQGTRVTLVMLNGVTHTFAAKDSVGQRSPGLTNASAECRRLQSASS